MRIKQTKAKHFHDFMAKRKDDKIDQENSYLAIKFTVYGNLSEWFLRGLMLSSGTQVLVLLEDGLNSLVICGSFVS